jgi:hypothetical protein
MLHVRQAMDRDPSYRREPDGQEHRRRYVNVRTKLEGRDYLMAYTA